MEGGEAGRVPLGQTRAVVNQHPGSLLVPTLSLGKIRTSGLGSDTFRSRERQISLFSTLRDSICESDSRTCQQGCINIVLLPSDNEMSPTISDCQWLVVTQPHWVKLVCFPTARCNGVFPASSFSPSLARPPWLMRSLTVWGLLCRAAMWRTVQPLLSLTGLLLPTSVRLTSERAELRQLEAISAVMEVSQLAQSGANSNLSHERGGYESSLLRFWYPSNIILDKCKTGKYKQGHLCCPPQPPSAWRPACSVWCFSDILISSICPTDKTLQQWLPGAQLCPAQHGVARRVPEVVAGRPSHQSRLPDAW